PHPAPDKLHAYLTGEDTIPKVQLELEMSTPSGNVKHGPFNVVLQAIGRSPNTEMVIKSGVELDKEGYIKTDKYQNTSVPNIYAVGDVCGPLLLPPTAIAAGRKLADRLF